VELFWFEIRFSLQLLLGSVGGLMQAD